jgi:hypothetical protein
MGIFSHPPSPTRRRGTLSRIQKTASPVWANRERMDVRGAKLCDRKREEALPSSNKKRLLVLFPNEWDKLEFSRPERASEYEVFYEGFDLFRFPENARLMWLDARRFVTRMTRKYASVGLSGVVSADEQFGSMLAAVLARALGLPGSPIAAILTAQHKYYARKLMQDLVPDATPRFCVFNYANVTPEQVTLPYPLFVKPVKATYSILARRVNNFAELREHLSFAPFEKHILERLILPADQLNADFMNFALDSHHIVAEELVSGHQVTVEGFVNRGEIKLFGVVDSVMFPGTCAFERFEYPSRLPVAVQKRMEDLTSELVRGFGYDHGSFNVELFYDAQTDAIKVIEINPRIAYQFADLYEKVDGFNSYDCMLALATDAQPVTHVRAGKHKHAASFVLRTFEQRALASVPSLKRVAEIEQQFEDSRIMVYIKRGASLAREFKWLGSYRYGLINMGAATPDALEAQYREAKEALGFRFA